MVVMTVCGLGYDELVEAIEKQNCMEALRLHKNPLNKHAIIFRHGGTTYCYAKDCPYSSTDRVNIDFQEIKYRLHLTDKEIDFVRSRDLDFLLDHEYVNRNVFTPSGHYTGYGWSEQSSGCAVPMRPMQFYAEDGDIVVYDDYDEDDNGNKVFYTHERVGGSARLKLLQQQLLDRPSGLHLPFTTDRFCIYEKEEDWCGIPNGVIIKHPKNTPLCILDERFNLLRWGVMGDYITHELPKEACWDLEYKLGSDAIGDIIKHPENIRTHLDAHRIYLSAYHKGQTKLDIFGKELAEA